MAENSKKSRGLGRGLSALMADVSTMNDKTVADVDTATAKSDRMIPIENIYPNPDQPRRHFNENQLNELADSIRVNGVIQPLIVRQRSGRTNEYEIVAGERRWRASQLAQQHRLPVIVRDFSDSEVLEIAIIENIQRADLNPVEEAAGYRQLMDKFGRTQEQMATALGKSRSHIANLLRLLNLPDAVQNFLKEGKLSAGHARALITSDHPVELANRIVAEGLSVRETERLVKKMAQGDVDKNKTAKISAPIPNGIKDADTLALEGDLSAALGLKVSVDHDDGRESGKLTIQYKNLEQLDDLCRLLSATV